MNIKNILVIDDEANFCAMIKINLESAGHGFKVDTALSAKEGFDKIAQQRYDIIFLDIIMPKIEGHEALQQIKKMCDTPVVVMSAYLPPQRKSAITNAGAYSCLEKPIELDHLIQLIGEIEKYEAMKKSLKPGTAST
ncbi:MAG: response regulator [Candidatus Omnitrophica bacterium]|nr:response regulator [Candidatus Omnitrophota bacterium]MDD5670536.1 response regulator [Candidatus Omnitrophota bacterium]